MNRVPGEIEQVRVHGQLSLVTVRAQTQKLSAIVIDTPNTCAYLNKGHMINAIFKETEVIIGQGHQHQVSLQNQFKGQIQSMEASELLSKLIISTEIGNITSIITTRAVQSLQLQVGSEVTAMIKTNEVMLSE